MTKLPGSSRTVLLVLRTKVFANTLLERYSQAMLTKTVRILRTGLTLCARASRRLLRMMTFKDFQRENGGMRVFNFEGFHVLVCHITLFRASFCLLGINF